MSIPQPGYQIHLSTILYGFILLGWLGIEDNTITSVTALGTGLALWLTYYGLAHHTKNQRMKWYTLPLAGLLGGGASALCTVILMFFKTAWHGHLFPDYPFGMMVAMLQRVPIWSIAGLMMGLAIWLILNTMNPNN